MVPLHGRLFAQWLHHAYPRECPYPHLSGTVSQQSPDEWEDSGSDSIASEEEMLQFTAPAAAANATVSNQESASDIGMTEALIWTPEEELLVERSIWSPAGSDSMVVSMPPPVRGLALFA